MRWLLRPSHLAIFATGLVLLYTLVGFVSFPAVFSFAEYPVAGRGYSARANKLQLPLALRLGRTVSYRDIESIHWLE
jgi:hypothetical protein